MKHLYLVAILSFICVLGCTTEKKSMDRSEATDMFNRICSLTKEYTEKFSEVPDSSGWATICNEFEDKLDKISFSYPPDTDLLLTEGQNDTIHALMLDYIRMRDDRIHEILYPVIELDTLIIDSTIMTESIAEIN